jgi:plasminogen activator
MTRSRQFTIPSLALALAAAVVAFAPASARAMHAAGQPGPGSLLTTAGGFSFSLGTSVGLVEGTASELAFYYPPPYGDKFKLSELTWDLKDVVMAGVHGSVGYGRWLRFNLGVWSALTEGNGMMVDRDWIYPDSVSAWLEPNDQNWTHESRHPDTSLDAGTIVDVNLSVLALPAGPFSLRGIVGYKNDTWNWSARGGTYIYSTEYPGSRDRTGSFPDGAEVITYEQQYSIPYIGVGADWAWPAFRLESHLLFSPAVSASDSDYHALRGVLFEGDFSGGTYLGLGLNATWAFARHWWATLGVEYQSISEITGDITISGEEGYGRFGDSGGIAMSAMVASLGAGFRF